MILKLDVLGMCRIFSFQVLRIFSAPRQFMETFQELCKVEEDIKVGTCRVLLCMKINCSVDFSLKPTNIL